MSATLRIPAADIPDGGAVKLGDGDDAVCIVRLGNDFHALGDRCSHARVSLSEGDVDAATRTIACWRHGSEFSLLDGHPQSLPATRPVPVYPVALDGADVVVRLP